MQEGEMNQESKDKKKCLAQGIDGCAICQPETHNILRGDLIRHKVGLGEIPSPYLKGYLDEFLSDGMLATFETVRGCPYACTFCGAGDPFYNKLIIRDEAVVMKNCCIFVNEQNVLKLI